MSGKLNYKTRQAHFSFYPGEEDGDMLGERGPCAKGYVLVITPNPDLTDGHRAEKVGGAGRVRGGGLCTQCHLHLWCF